MNSDALKDFQFILEREPDFTLAHEGAGRAYGLTVGPMGEVQVLVPEHQSQEARQIVDDYYAGKFDSDEGEDSGQDNKTQG